ncbi:hypothetical protein GCWU000324_00265 [Kingella oralis ATCC 51147]|jgi:hypothetical protein|uniref:Uncharacterized protein n=1 Tax=Kingella oralis ATCC 51147 TaxID=629741 RepID=C4GHD2_9NEIS|nr:hypothetical protein GCWU000324_00265 [Kingella oralis ATCC 51147]
MVKWAVCSKQEARDGKQLREHGLPCTQGKVEYGLAIFGGIGADMDIHEREDCYKVGGFGRT